MKNTLHAVVAASLAMLATSGIVALATAAPAESTTLTDAEHELVAQLDAAIARQITTVKERLTQPRTGKRRPTP